MEDILQSAPCKFVIADYVKDKEIIGYIKIYNEGELTQKQINLQPIIDKNLLAVVSIRSETESIDYINFCYEFLENGEAITGAIAKNRNWGIATDDTKCIDILNKNVPHVQIFTTPHLIKNWYEIRRPSTFEIKTTLKNIQCGGRYRPGPKHPLHRWWNNVSTGA